MRFGLVCGERNQRHAAQIVMRVVAKGVLAGDFAAAGTGAVSADFVGAALAGLAGAASSDFAASAATFMLVAPEVLCVSELVVLPLASAADVALPSTLLAVPSALLAVLSTLLAALEASFLST